MKLHALCLFVVCPLFLSLSACTSTSTVELARSRPVSSSGIITKLEGSSRTLTLRNSYGQVFSIVAGDQVENFDRFKLGDRIKAIYASAVALSIDPTEASSAEKIPVTEVRASLGQMPSAVDEETVEARGAIDMIDFQDRVLTLRTVAGESASYAVPASVQNFDDLKIGDEVAVRATQPIAVKISALQATR